jgi:hypothetical protein
MFGMSVVLGGKNPRHDADITSQADLPVLLFEIGGPAQKMTFLANGP